MPGSIKTPAFDGYPRLELTIHVEPGAPPERLLPESMSVVRQAGPDLTVAA